MQQRIQCIHDVPPAREGRFVLYWMQQQRRLQWNYALDYALRQARQQRLPLLIYEGLRVDYPHASDRHHAWALDGMLEHQQRLGGQRVGYFPYVEEQPGAGRGLVQALLAQASEVISDEVPCFIVPGHNRALARIARALDRRASLVDSCGILPLRLLERPCPSAAVFRRHAHRHLAQQLAASPQAKPLAGLRIPAWDDAAIDAILARWPRSTSWLEEYRSDPAASLAALPIDHQVSRLERSGGATAGQHQLATFLDQHLAHYAARRCDPLQDHYSGLSPYLHWGQISSHEILFQLWQQEAPVDLGLLPEQGGSKEGFWPLSPAAQRFLDQLIIWRELGLHSAQHRAEDFSSLALLPAWARATLQAHAADPRPKIYSQEQLEAAETEDPLWNATMRQLRSQGHIHSYLRMLWGKKFLEWTPDPDSAYAYAMHLNNKWSIDGRDANSWAAVAWCFGCFDRPWFERPIFGTVRYMTSASTQRKFPLKSYLQHYAGP